MKNFISNLSFVAVILFCCTTYCQVGIGTVTPKAILDIVVSNPNNPSNTDGILIPRVEQFSTINPTAEQNGLLVYLNTDVGSNSSGLYYWDNSANSWVRIVNTDDLIINRIVDADADTMIQVEETTDEDVIRFDIEGTEQLVIKKSANGSTYIETEGDNVLIGENISTNSFDNNVVIGHNAGASLNGSLLPRLNSGSSVFSNGDASENVLIGYEAGNSTTAGSSNVYLGYRSGYLNSVGFNNTYLGTGAGWGTNSWNNIYVGHSAGKNHNGQNNILIGNNAGSNSNGSNLLYIENSDSSSPLIYGNFNTDLIRVNGTLDINNAYQFPLADGFANQVLQTDGAGNLIWRTDTDQQDLSLSGNILSITNDASPIDLSGYLDNTDAQQVDKFTLNGNIIELSLENDSVSDYTLDLSSIITTNTDQQDLSLSGNILSITNAASPIDLSGYLDNTDAQQVDKFTLNGNIIELSLENDSVSDYTLDLSSIITTNTDQQDLSLSGNILSITNAASSIDLSGYLDNTDVQQVDKFSLNGNIIELSLENDSVPDYTLDLSSVALSTAEITDVDGDTKIQVEESVDEDVIRFDIAGVEKLILKTSLDGSPIFDIDGSSVNIGNNISALNNRLNVVLGNNAGTNMNNAERNVFIGTGAGRYNSNADFNVFIGNQSGIDNSTGQYNTFIGSSSGSSNTTGWNNVYIGRNSGLNANGANNVFLGKSSGENVIGSHKLYIDNTNTSSPLIYGEFDNDLLRVNGVLDINNSYKFPISDGIGNQVLKTDGSGNLSWSTENDHQDLTLTGNTLSITNDSSPVDLSGYFDNTDEQQVDKFSLIGNIIELSLQNDGVADYTLDLSSLVLSISEISDLDADTRIQVEESVDEDVIRFDIESEERLILTKNTNGNTVFQFPNSGGANLFIGNNSGISNSSGTLNTFLGNSAGENNTTGEYNSFFGRSSGRYNTTGSSNTFIGNASGTRNTIGNYNTFIGQGAGRNNLSGSRNTFIGYRVGYNETGSNKLYIANSDTSNPLIYGEFDNNLLRINGTLNINNAFSMPNTDGTANQVLTTNGNGAVSWSTPTFIGVAETGTTSAISGTGIVSQTLTFSGTYTSIPKVLVTVHSGNSSEIYIANVVSVSTTQATVNVYRIDNGGGILGSNINLEYVIFEN